MIGLRRAVDLDGLATLVATLFLLAVLVTGMCRHPLLWVLATLACYRVCVINHNHQHLPLFRRSWANRAINVPLTLGMGLPGSVLIPLHNRNHHQSNNRTDDAMGTGHLTLRTPLLRLLLYPLVAAVRWRPRRAQVIAATAVVEPWLHQRFRTEQLALVLALLAAALLGGWMGVVSLVAPWAMAQYWVVNANYLQHDGCDPESPDAHVRTFTGSLLNWFTFNGGYHLVHHERPDLHWRDLKVAHETRVPAPSPTRVERSLVWYLLRLVVGRA